MNSKDRLPGETGEAPFSHVNVMAGVAGPARMVIAANIARLYDNEVNRKIFINGLRLKLEEAAKEYPDTLAHEPLLRDAFKALGKAADEANLEHDRRAALVADFATTLTGMGINDLRAMARGWREEGPRDE